MAFLVGRSASFASALLIISVMFAAFPDITGGYDTSESEHISVWAFDEEEIIGNWTVTGLVTRSSRNITLSGNLSIQGTLILDNVNLYLNGSGRTLSSITVNPGGVLLLRNNSMVAGKAEKRYHFRALSGSVVNIDSTVVTGCGIPIGDTWRTGLTVETKFFNITNSRVENGYGGVIVDSGSADIDSVEITSMSGSGLKLMNGSTLRSQWLNFTHCFGSALELNRSSASLSNTIFDSCYTAVSSLSSTLVMSRSLLVSISQETVILNSTDMELIDSYLPMPGNDLIKITEPAGTRSSLFLLNTTPGDIMILDPGAEVNEAYRHDFKVMTNGGLPAEGAVLTIRDFEDEVESVITTDEKGYVLDHPVVRFQFDSGGSMEKEPHNLSIVYQGAKRYKDFSTIDSYCERINVFLTNPVVDITDPVGGSWLPSSSMKVMGTVDDERPITNIDYILDGLDPAQITVSDQFVLNLTLPDGNHVISITAENDDGNTGSDMIEFGIDTVFPKITVDRSIIPDYTKESTITVKGTCSEDKAKVYVGQDMVSHSGGVFSVSYQLKEGMNEILVKAVDRAGNTAETKITVVSDTIPPPVHVRSFLNGSRVRGSSIWVNGTTDLSTVKILVNGGNVPFTGDTFSYLLTGLVEGANTIIVTAEDRAGSVSKWKGTVIVDNTPPDLIVFDLPSATNLESFRIRGRTEPGSKVFVNGLLADVAADEWSIVIDLFPGANPVHITAYDDLDNGIELSHIIIYDNEPPVIDNIDPTPGSTVRNPALTIRISIYDEFGLSMVRGKSGGGDFKSLTEGDVWTWTVTLSVGINNLTLEAVDIAGNSEYRYITYIYYPKSEADTEPPVVIINTPESGSKHPPGLINIEGEAYDNIRVDIIQIRINGTEWIEIEGSTVWHYLFNFSKGMNSIEVRAVDEAGNIGNITMISILVVGTTEDSSSDSTTFWIILTILGAIIFVFLCGVLFYTFVSYTRLKATQEGLEEAARESREFRRRPAPLVGRERSRREDPGDMRPPSGGKRKRAEKPDAPDKGPGARKAGKPPGRRSRRV
ncbi:MAG: hypothetical protein ACMUIG_06285 [Thermoplasmatota archaeon]